MKQQILLERHLILLEENNETVDEKTCAYYNTYLYVNFGVEIVNKECVNEEVLRQLSEVFRLNVPDSFYKNPQDTKNFTCEELFLEQVVSYFLGYGTSLGRVELFEKYLPEFVVDGEITIRQYRIIFKEEADKVLKEVMNDLCSYKRPFSDHEAAEFVYLLKEGYYTKGTSICCKDNIFLGLESDIELAKQLDKKDVVKLSIKLIGESDHGINEFLKAHKNVADLLAKVIPLVNDCPMSKKQAKYFNKIVTALSLDIELMDNEQSPYRLAKVALDKGNVLGAAKILKNNGSLFLRNIKMLLSRANEEETITLLSMLGEENPIVQYQILTSLDLDIKNVARTFRFFDNSVAKSHLETEYETRYRKSCLSDEKKKVVQILLTKNIISYYSKLPKLGKIYISDEFSHIALPVNTSATGNGLDVLPAGSRVKFDAKYVRTYCYWEGIYDVDASLVVLSEEDFLYNDFDAETENLSWRTYHSKPFGNAALCSGDCTDIKGAEYQDIDIEELYKLGYRYAISCLNGYGSKFNIGSVHAGLQIKNRLDTSAWDPKNIEFDMIVKSDGRSFTCFAIDLKTKEIIVTNTKSNYGCVVDNGQVNVVRNYLSSHYLDINMKTILENSGEIVNKQEDADYVFDREYQGKENQKVIRPFDVAALVKIVNR